MPQENLQARPAGWMQQRFYFTGLERKHHPMKRIQTMAISPATLRLLIILYLRCPASGSRWASSHPSLWWHLHFRNSISSAIDRFPRTCIPSIRERLWSWNWRDCIIRKCFGKGRHLQHPASRTHGYVSFWYKIILLFSVLPYVVNHSRINTWEGQSLFSPDYLIRKSLLLWRQGSSMQGPSICLQSASSITAAHPRGSFTRCSMRG